METHFKNSAIHLIMILAMAFAFFACEEKKKPEAEQPVAEAEATPTEEVEQPVAEEASEAVDLAKQYKELAEQEKAEEQAKLALSICENDIFTDFRDNKTYKCVKIGSQTWMAEDLALNGELRYNLTDAMKYCPKGWHLPSDAEWQVLVDFAGGESVAGRKLKSKSSWDECYEESPCDDDCKRCPPKESNGTDDYGFAALPGGACFMESEGCSVGPGGWWWTSSIECNAYGFCGAPFRNMAEEDRVLRGDGGCCSFSVRCVKD